jgi:DNA-binding transcriptional ArsR family regulator
MSERSHELAVTAASRPAPDECEALIVDTAAVERVSDELPDERVVQRAADIFSALADPTRLRILQALVIEDLCVCDLASVARVSQSAVSHQLRLLRDRDLVAFRREGKRAVYRLSDEHVRVLLVQGIAHAQERR